MNEEITAKATFDAPTMLLGHRWYLRHAFGRRWTFWLAVMLVMISGIPDVMRTGQFQMCWQVWALIGVFIYLPAMHWLAKRIYARELKSSPSYGHEVNYVFDEHGMQVTLLSGVCRFDWSHFKESISSPDGALIFAAKRAYNWLPKTAFTSEADYNRFLDLLAVKTKHSKLS